MFIHGMVRMVRVSIIMVVHLPPAAGQGGGSWMFHGVMFYLAIIIKIHRKLKVAPMSKIRRIIKKAREEWLTFR
jgi:hypothetical protein